MYRGLFIHNRSILNVCRLCTTSGLCLEIVDFLYPPVNVSKAMATQGEKVLGEVTL